ETRRSSGRARVLQDDARGIQSFPYIPKHLMTLIRLCFLLLILGSISVAQTSTISARAKAIHDSAIVIDTHADTPQRFLDENYDIGSTDPNDHGHISLDKARAGNLGAEFFSIWVEPTTNEWADPTKEMDNPQIQHHNDLTDSGKKIVQEINRLGMMVDISHVSDKTFWDTIAVTKAPLIASHSSARALSNHPRNMTDEMLQAVAKNSGVVQVNFYNAFIDENYRQAAEAQKKDRDAAVAEYVAQRKAAGQPVTYLDQDRIEREWAAKIPRPPLKSLIDNIDHIAKVAGIDHAGLGSDFDGVS